MQGYFEGQKVSFMKRPNLALLALRFSLLAAAFVLALLKIGALEIRNNRKGGTASLRSRTCVKRNAAFGTRFKGLSLYFPYQKGI